MRTLNAGTEADEVSNKQHHSVREKLGTFTRPTTPYNNGADQMKHPKNTGELGIQTLTWRFVAHYATDRIALPREVK